MRVDECIANCRRSPVVEYGISRRIERPFPAEDDEAEATAGCERGCHPSLRFMVSIACNKSALLIEMRLTPISNGNSRTASSTSRGQRSAVVCTALRLCSKGAAVSCRRRTFARPSDSRACPTSRHPRCCRDIRENRARPRPASGLNRRPQRLRLPAPLPGKLLLRWLGKLPCIDPLWSGAASPWKSGCQARRCLRSPSCRSGRNRRAQWHPRLYVAVPASI